MPTEKWEPQEPGQYGPRMVGEETFDRLQTIQRTKRHRFGPRIIGERVDDRSTEEVEAQKATEKGVLSPDFDNENVTKAIEKAAGEDGYLSVDNLKKALDDGPPATFDRLLHAELTRNPPRKSALRHFLSVEQKRDKPRDEVFRIIESTLQARSEEE